jgi:hypothetical protein
MRSSTSARVAFCQVLDRILRVIAHPVVGAGSPACFDGAICDQQAGELDASSPEVGTRAAHNTAHAGGKRRGESRVKLVIVGGKTLEDRLQAEKHLRWEVKHWRTGCNIVDFTHSAHKQTAAQSKTAHQYP